MANKEIKEKEMEMAKVVEKVAKEKKLEKAKKIAGVEREKAEQAIHAAIKKLLILNKKAKIKIIAGTILAKRYIAKNRIKIKKYELAAKREPKLVQFFKAKADDLKAKNILLIKIINSFSDTETELNKEIGSLTNEAGALYTKDFALVKKAVTRESNLLIKQREILIALFKLIKILRVKKAVLKKKDGPAKKQSVKQPAKIKKKI